MSRPAPSAPGSSTPSGRPPRPGTTTRSTRGQRAGRGPDLAIGAARAATAQATSPPRDPGGRWRAALAKLPGGAGGALIGAWEDYAWARECGGASRADAERLAFDDVRQARGAQP
jgi:hypothetical protein